MDNVMGRRDGTLCLGSYEVVPGGIQGGSDMSFYHWQPPKEEDYSTEEEFLEAYEAWERAEDDYEEYMEMRREERNNQIFI